MEIVLYPDPILRVQTANVLEIDETLAERVGAMIRLMHSSSGIGLAAPQIGWNARLFVCNPSREDGGTDRVFINPEILSWSGRDVREEGCLSLPGILGKVVRPTSIRIRAYDLDGEEIEEEMEGLLARVFQHEHDHLEGILIIDKMSPAERLGVERDLKELEDRYNKARPKAAQRAPGGGAGR